MILLMGGTGESALIAEAIRNAGFYVLISQATEIALALPSGPDIESRHGRLNLDQLVALIEERGVTALVDAMHPFAVEAHKTAMQAAQSANIPYLHWLREESVLTGFSNLHMAADHQRAARIAVALGYSILLTIGSRNLSPYVLDTRKAGLPIYARVLPCQESEEACRRVGLDKSEVIPARGPFTVEDTLSLLRTLKVGTLVTKESGNSGGVPEKLEAAKRAKCNVVIVQRALFNKGYLCRTLDELIEKLVSCR